nr:MULTISPECIES: type 4 pilus major pilin [unclassified Paraburkholderia]
MQHETIAIVSRRASALRMRRIRRPAVAREMQRGASLLEAIAYLGIAAIVVIGAVALMNGAFNSASTNELAEQVNAIQSGVKKLYMGQTNGYTGIDNGVLASAGVFPSTIPASSSGTATNAWGGTVTVAAGAATGGTAGTFTIVYTSVPQAVCINALTAGGSWVSVGTDVGTENTVPVPPSTAKSDCANSSNTITWTSS